mmetsp:Transcript_22973/g.23623  ORF Transcript_22973/g.23623 Transcript_22973/m.23623 type:complete len:163 (+) Transcript_22973:68-556(+)
MSNPYLDVMTIRSSNGSSKICHDGKTNLLVEPIHLPEMVHVQLDPSRADSQETRLFYATGEKNPNLNKHIENALKNNTLEYQEAHIHSSLAHTAHSRTKPSIHHILHPSPARSTKKSNSTALIPKPKPELFHSKKPDRETENMILNFRKNEVKLASMVRTVT